MSIIVAKKSMGFCPGCGIQIEAGETVSIVNNLAAHVGCGQKLEQVGTEKRDGSAKFELKKENPGQVRGTSRQKTEPQSGFLFSDAETAIIEHAQEVIGVKHVSFDGATVLQIDTPRLAGQLAKVFELMRDGRFRTLAQIASVAGCLETSVSARLRDLRKARFGSHAVVSRQVEGVPLVYEYRLIVNERKEIDGRRDAA